MSRNTIRAVIALAVLAPIAVYAQQKASQPAPTKAPMKMDGMKMDAAKPAAGDAQKITSAEGAGPANISKHAAIMDWPDKAGAQMRQLRAGTNGWMCMPDGGTPDTPAMCADKTWGDWAGAFMTGKEPPKPTTTGIAYMLRGDRGASNTDPHATGPTATNQWVVAPAHVMLLVPDSKMLDAYPTDPKTGGPWVMWKGTPYAHVMVPVSATAAATMPPAPAAAKKK